MAVPLLFSRGRAFRASADRFIPPLCSGTAKPALQSLTEKSVFQTVISYFFNAFKNKLNGIRVSVFQRRFSKRYFNSLFFSFFKAFRNFRIVGKHSQKTCHKSFLCSVTFSSCKKRTVQKNFCRFYLFSKKLKNCCQ